MPVMVACVRRWSGSWLGAVLATGVAALHDQFIFYGVEARPYAMIQVASLFQAFLFFEVMADVSRNDVAGNQWKRLRWPSCSLSWCCATIFLFYLHYTTIIFIAAEGLLLFSFIVATGRRKGASLWPLFCPCVCILLGVLPGFIHLMQLGGGRSAWSAMSNADAYGLQALAYGLIYLVPGISVGLLQRFQGEQFPMALPKLTWLLTLVGIPMLFCYLGTQGRFAPLAHVRFSIASLTLLVATMGVIVGRLKGRSQVSLAIVTALLCIVTNPLLGWWIDNGGYPRQRREDWREVFLTVAEDPATIVFCPNLVEDSLVTSQSATKFPRDYYRFALAGLYPVETVGCSIIPAAIQDTSAWLTELEILQLSESPRGFWLLVRAYPSDAQLICDRLLGELDSIGIGFQARRTLSAPLNLFRLEPK